MHEPQLLGLHTETHFLWSHFVIGNKLYEFDVILTVHRR